MKNTSEIKPKILLHICCAGCGVYIAQILKEEFEVIFYFYNPNINSQKEYEKRLDEIKKIAKNNNINLIIGNYDHKSWLERIKGYEKELEKGRRCEMCYEDRMKKTAEKAIELGVGFFTTTLSVSPHKDYSKIKKIGCGLASRYSLNFLERDFKKQEGYKKSVELSKRLNLYRQNYCGCEFSKKS